MPERIYKLQPNRTIQLRGFSDLGAAAALHSATATGFEVSGIFRDPADFCVLTLYDCDNYYEHPLLKHLPDTNFDGLTLEFDVYYTGLRNLDSPRYPIIDWPYLDITRADSASTTGQIRLFDTAGATPGTSTRFVSGTWTPASAKFTVIVKNPQPYDHLTLWYLNRAFDFMVPQLTAAFAFTVQGAGTVHSLVVAGVTYSYTEIATDTVYSIAQGVAQALAPASSLVTAKAYMNQVNLQAVPGSGQTFDVYDPSNPAGKQTLSTVSLTAESIAADLARQCNAMDWTAAGADIPLTAQALGAQITFTAAKPGVDGNALSMYALWKNDNLKADQTLVQFAGGSSDATWHVKIDFTAAGFTQIRRMWLTFAPPLAIGQAFQATEWQAKFSNWTVSGPDSVRALQVAGPGSLRIEETSSACSYSGSWAVDSTDGFFSEGYAKASKQAGSSVTVQYETVFAHELWLGTSLYTDRGRVNVTIDGTPAAPFNAYLNTGNDPAVVTRRQLAASLSPGSHTVVLTTVDDKKAFYFDFLEAVVRSDVPDNLPARTNISPALDYSTDHTYKLPPTRIMWMFDKLGFAGPVNQYIGVFWWNQRARTGAVIPQVVVTFGGAFQAGDQVWLNIAGTKIGKSVLATDTATGIASDTSAAIARHFACYVNATFVGLWASASGSVLTLTSQSPTANFQFSFKPSVDSSGSTGSTGTVTYTGTLQYATPQTGDWIVDPTQTPPLNRGVRDWEADLFNECKSRNREVTVAASMELVQPPDAFTARYHNGDAVKTSVGYGSSWWSSQCAFNSAMLAYQKQVYDSIAGLMTTAGVPVSVQFGEFCWWYFPSQVDNSMAFYDADTKDAAKDALGGRKLALFRTPTDDPQVNGGADATFLRNRLRDHVASLVAYIGGKYPGAKFELLFPYDVNYPVPAGVNKLGGRLLRFVNFPAEWQVKSTSGLDRIKMEGLDFGSASRDLNLVQDVMEFPIQLGWPLDSIRYMLPVFNGGCPWISEYRMAKGLGIPVINLWAFDHVCLFNLSVAEPAQPARSMRF